jgi:hypothetical protein
MIDKKALFMFITISYLFLTGCATVDGMRTDVGNGVTWVGDKIKPCNTEKCKNGR